MAGCLGYSLSNGTVLGRQSLSSKGQGHWDANSMSQDPNLK